MALTEASRNVRVITSLPREVIPVTVVSLPKADRCTLQFYSAVAAQPSIVRLSSIRRQDQHCGNGERSVSNAGCRSAS